MRNKERILWIVLLVIISALSLGVVIQYQTKLSKNEQSKTSLSNEKTHLEQENRDYAAQKAKLESEIEKLKLTNLANYNQTTLLELQREGFSGQLEDIVADLKMHRELIPYKGVLGGTMGFYDNNDIHVLTDRWVFACFQDGHISGYMLLRYDIKNGNISWEVIDSYLNDV